jgi:hypothetical protein
MAGDAFVAIPINNPIIPATHITQMIARCLPKRIAASLPRILDGMASTVASTLTVIGWASDDPPLLATT